MAQENFGHGHHEIAFNEMWTESFTLIYRNIGGSGRDGEISKGFRNSSVILSNDNDTTFNSLLEGCSKSSEANKLA